MENNTRLQLTEIVPVVWHESTWQPRVVIRRRRWRLASVTGEQLLDGRSFTMLRMGIMGDSGRTPQWWLAQTTSGSGTQPRIKL